jgi:5'-nucleotidase
MKSKKKPLILITNDDGIFASGIQHLAKAMISIGDVYVVAPDQPQSGMGHAVTIRQIIRAYRSSFPVKVKEAFCCSGTPVDCVKLALNNLLPARPDIIVSGINHGSNASVNVIYSGTMSAAVEGALEKIPSVGFSLLDFSPEANFTASVPVAQRVVKNVLKHGLPEGVCLNVNIPKLPLKKIKGIRYCRQAKGHWAEGFEKRTDPHGGNYYWMSGQYVLEDNREDADENALAAGYVSVVPVHADLTDYNTLKKINQWSSEI